MDAPIPKLASRLRDYDNEGQKIRNAEAMQPDPTEIEISHRSEARFSELGQDLRIDSNRTDCVSLVDDIQSLKSETDTRPLPQVDFESRIQWSPKTIDALKTKKRRNIQPNSPSYVDNVGLLQSTEVTAPTDEFDQYDIHNIMRKRRLLSPRRLDSPLQRGINPDPPDSDRMLNPSDSTPRTYLDDLTSSVASSTWPSSAPASYRAAPAADVCSNPSQYHAADDAMVTVSADATAEERADPPSKGAAFSPSRARRCGIAGCVMAAAAVLAASAAATLVAAALQLAAHPDSPQTVVWAVAAPFAATAAAIGSYAANLHAAAAARRAAPCARRGPHAAAALQPLLPALLPAAYAGEAWLAIRLAPQRPYLRALRVAYEAAAVVSVAAILRAAAAAAGAARAGGRAAAGRPEPDSPGPEGLPPWRDSFPLPPSSLARAPACAGTLRGAVPELVGPAAGVRFYAAVRIALAAAALVLVHVPARCPDGATDAGEDAAAGPGGGCGDLYGEGEPRWGGLYGYEVAAVTAAQLLEIGRAHV